MKNKMINISILIILVFLGLFLILGSVQNSNISEEYNYLTKTFKWMEPLKRQESIAKNENNDGTLKENKEIVFSDRDYDKIYDMNKAGYYIIEKNGKKGIVDVVKNKVIAETIYDYIGQPGEKYIYVRGDEAGYIDYEGKLVIPLSKYSKGCKFSEGLAIVFYDDKVDVINDKGFDVFTSKAKIDLRLHEKEIDECYFSQGIAPITFDGEKYGYVNNKGKMLVKPVFEYAGPVVKENAEVSFYGTGGVILIDGSEM